MEKRITITEETTNVNLEADKGTRIANQVENNLGATKALNDDDDIDDDDTIDEVDENVDEETVTEEEVVIEEDVDEEDLDEDEDDDDDEDA